ncbi:hypothetical protein ABQG68_06150 [Bacillus pumilus]|uniref:hypothetical protein n=1 Tax=Bacillus pumilus TaxID=1408 RepID=UPI003315F636
MKKRVIDAVHACIYTKEPMAVTIHPYEIEKQQCKNQHHLLLMLKPELTSIHKGVQLDRILDELLVRLDDRDVEIGAIRVISSLYLKEKKIIESQYGMLNKISKNGLSELSDAAKKMLIKKYPEFKKKEHLIYGGHQFLQKYQELTPYGLELLTRNVEVDKLGAGTYAIEAEVDGEKMLLLNSFHPCQIEWFTAPAKAVIVIECFSKQPMRMLREDFIGTTDPKEAKAGSFKHMLLTEQKRFGLSNVCTRFNGIHLSPGPVEAMAGIVHYFHTPETELTPAHTFFGQLLKKNGFSAEELDLLCEDVSIRSSETPVFELTENLNWDEALDLLIKVKSDIQKHERVL